MLAWSLEVGGQLALAPHAGQVFRVAGKHMVVWLCKHLIRVHQQGV